MLTKKQILSSFSPLLNLRYNYSGNTKTMYVKLYDKFEDLSFKNLHGLFSLYLGVWNKHRKANSKKLKHDINYRKELLAKMIAHKTSLSTLPCKIEVIVTVD